MSGPVDPRELCGEDAAAYVLGALEEAEHEAFVAHLRTCPACRDEVAELQTVADALPAAVPQVRAPDRLRGRLMATVRSEAELRRAGSGSAVPRRAPSRWFGMRRLAIPLAAAAAAAALVLALLLTAGGGSSTRVIRAQAPGSAARVSLLVSADRGTLRIAGMPSPAPGRVYEVWVKRSGGPQPTDALFKVSSSGSASVGVPGSLRGVRTIMVTSEPEGGSTVPTTKPVIVANL